MRRKTCTNKLCRLIRAQSARAEAKAKIVPSKRRPGGLIKIGSVWAHAQRDGACWACGERMAVAAAVFSSTTFSPCVYGYCRSCLKPMIGDGYGCKVKTPEQIEAARSHFALRETA